MIYAGAIVLLAALLLFQAALILAAMVWGATFIAIAVAAMSVAFSAFIVTTAYAALFGAPFVPTDNARVATMLRLAGVGPDDTVADLGCGDGRIVIAAAKTGARAEGWEVNPVLWLVSRWRIARAGVRDSATARLGSYWHEKFPHASVVTLFLIDTQMERMERKLLAELAPGSRVVSYAFKFPHWKPEASEQGIHLYVHPGAKSVNGS
jgi:hypothetical protein